MITTPITADLLHGHAETEPTPRGLRPHRLQAWARERFPDPQLLSMESRPSGVRVDVLTTARQLELVVHSTRIAYQGLDRLRGSTDLLVDHQSVGTELLDGGDVAADAIRLGQVRPIAAGQGGDRAQDRLSLRVIRAAMASLVAQRADPQLRYLDGTELYGPEDAVAHPLPDGLRPDAAAHELIGRRFASGSGILS